MGASIRFGEAIGMGELAAPHTATESRCCQLALVGSDSVAQPVVGRCQGGVVTPGPSDHSINRLPSRSV